MCKMMNETKAKTTAKKKQQNNIIDKPPVAAIIKLLEQSQHRFLNGSYSDMREVFGKFLDVALATLEYQPVEMACTQSENWQSNLKTNNVVCFQTMTC